MAAYLGLSIGPFNYCQHFHPKRQFQNGLKSASSEHGTAAQVKFIYLTQGQGVSINYMYEVFVKNGFKKILHGFVRLHNVGKLLQHQIRYIGKIFENECGRCNAQG
jgi:hypothetical protein